MRAGRLRPGSIAVVLLLCIGVGIVSVALPGDADDAGYYDGDGDDAAAVPQRLDVLSDVAICAAGLVLELRTPGTFEPSVAAVPPPIIAQSRPPLLRSPPSS
jgi:hypothetical protein